MEKLEETLVERSGQHGSFAVNAAVTEDLMDIMRKTPNWRRLTAVQKVALYFVMHKAGRIGAGDPDFIDHWHDIAGYAKLAEDEARARKAGVSDDDNPAAMLVCQRCEKKVAVLANVFHCFACASALNEIRTSTPK